MKFPISFLLALCLAPAALAEESELPQFVRTVIVDVQPEQINDFVAAQKELNAAAKKAGFPRRTTYEVVFGPTPQFRIVEPVDSLAELNEARLAKAMPDDEERSNWLERIRKCQGGREVSISRLFSDLSVPPDDPKQYIVLHLWEHMAGRRTEFVDMMRDKLVPAVEEAGATIWTFKRALGGNNRQWVIALAIEGYEDLNDRPSILGPLAGALPAEELEDLALSIGENVESGERIVMRLREDLSFSNND